MSQRSFIAGARSLNEKDLHDNLTYFKVPQTGIESIRSKLAFKIFDEYANILKDMYSTRFNGHPKDNSTHSQRDTTPSGPSPPLITSLQVWQLGGLITLDVLRRRKRREMYGINLHTLHPHLGGDKHADPPPQSHIQRNGPHVPTR